MATLTQSTTVDKIEIMSTGIIGIRLLKQVLSDTTVISAEYHRITVTPIDTLDTVYTNLNTNLTSSGFAELSTTEWTKVTSQAAVAWTDTVIAAYKELIGES